MNKTKEVQAIMLPTTNGSKLHKSNLGNLYTTPNKSTSVVSEDFHLYFLNNEEIKEDDWFYNNGEIVKQDGATSLSVICGTNLNGVLKSYYKKDSRKIIATTDQSLNLPRPSNSFLQKYVEEYNKGNVIEKVLVEYEEKENEDIQKELGIFGHDEGLTEGEYNEYIKNNDILKLKVAPDNTITIKPVNSNNKQHLQWIYNRMIEVHKENPNVDYMLKFKEILEKLK